MEDESRLFHSHETKDQAQVRSPAKEDIAQEQRPYMKFRKFQKSTELLIPKMAFLQIVREMLQCESMEYRIQVGAILALHEATEAYLIQLMEDTNLCTIHAKHVTDTSKRHAIGKKNLGETLG